MSKPRRGAAVLAVLAVVATPSALVVAGASAHTLPAARIAHSASTTVTARTNKVGTFLVGPNGDTLYLWAKDQKNKAECTGQCAEIWPPLMLKGKLVGTHGVKTSLLGSIKVSGGRQVTYDGHPLYYYQADSKPGQTNGEGSDSFGAPWYVVSTSGKAITN